MSAKAPEFLEGPQKLRAYYVRIAAGNPRNPQWPHGVEVCDLWLDLQRKEALTQSDIDAVLNKLQSELKAGSGWYIMRDQFTSWAKEKGFVA